MLWPCTDAVAVYPRVKGNFGSDEAVHCVMANGVETHQSVS